ncbi:aminotransferase class I/II-fold pyridoxal phosphate-dependent enzyme [Comamonas sp. NoAH]|uniref:aminotransferase class I/II-fold pyridoxal phosphate-dependent enzyme n=1 Tax=Comamonas halotolerans TaxID=3041496 RepID=UPI0024E06931|nr:aminotransferase class I/II-fold pyridoxal phosphate-dependent enzyme [Comamonas sp. NoAH]
MAEAWVHGGTDALGIPAHDFSTNRNACGPCPQAVQALQDAHCAQYPDPSYTALREQLAQFHGVSAQRIVVAGSASEFIHRITMHAVRQGAACVTLPEHHYGDYAQAAQVWGLLVADRARRAAGPGLHWACAPSSPLGQEDMVCTLWAQTSVDAGWRVLDCAYAPLRLEEASQAFPLEHIWQMWTPNKALGMTGVRAAYAIAPLHTSAQELLALRQLAPSWVVGAHGVAMLQAWTTAVVQQWLQHSLQQLQTWKAQQLQMCERLGWQLIPGHQANYMVARWPEELQTQMSAMLNDLRAQGIKLRDCASFGLPGCVRMGVLPQASQQALESAWKALELTGAYTPDQPAARMAYER